MSDNEAARLVARGLMATHKNELSEVRAGVLREYVTEDYIRSRIRLFITPKTDAEFRIDPWFHILFCEGNTIEVSIDADVVFDVYRNLKQDGKTESTIEEMKRNGKTTVSDVLENYYGRFLEFDLCYGNRQLDSFDSLGQFEPIFLDAMR